MIVSLILRRYNVWFMALLTNLLTRAGDLSGRYQEVVSIRYLSTTSIFLKKIAVLYHLYNREIPIYEFSLVINKRFCPKTKRLSWIF